MYIDEACFVVTDTETTGTRAGANRIIEIGAVKVCAGVVVERFSQLINPGCAIPGHITRLTGITTAMVFGQPRAADVIPAYMDFLGDGILVAHNLSFDRRFIDAELARLGRGAWSGQSLCTLRMARRLLRGLRSKGLASVADFYGIRITGRHRALGDAEATAHVLVRFLQQMADEYAVEHLDDLLAFQNRSYRQIRPAASHLRRIHEETLPHVPDAPGVYFMKNARGEIIYIGKALSLSARVRSYFNAVEAHSDHLRRLVADTREVGWKVTASELGALILESRLIKQHQPRYNRAQLEYRARPFLRLDASESFPRLTVTTVAHNDAAEYYGPFAGRAEAEFMIGIVEEFFDVRPCDDATFSRGKSCLLAEMDRCPTRPCENADRDAYAVELTRVRRFLAGDDLSLLDEIELRMKAASAALEFERASEYRDAHRRLSRLLGRQAALRKPVFRQNGVVIWPRKDGVEVALVIGQGRLVGEYELSVGEKRRGDLMSAVRACLAAAPSARYWREEADELRLIQHWLHRNRNAIRSMPLDEIHDEQQALSTLGTWFDDNGSKRALVTDS